MNDVTRPNRRLGNVQRVRPIAATRQRGSLTSRQSFAPAFWFLVFVVMALVYLFAPIRTNILLLGTDDAPERGPVGRTDTIILATVVPWRPYIGLLSIPRDLWVNIPGLGQQRINTAYFYAEAATPGSGPRAALQTVQANFGVPVQYHAVIHMQGLVSVVDALGGVEIHLTESMGGLPAGTHHLDGFQALNFVRDRNNSDDFSRMQRAQLLIAAGMGKALQPTSWPALPRWISSLPTLIDTNLPVWQWPRLSFALLRSALPGGQHIDHQSISREMVTPFETEAGAQVLAPNWASIRPLLEEMFGS